MYNSLNKTTPDNYDTIIKNLRKYYKKTSAKNSKILELSSITIRKDETITEFDLRFSDILNQVNKTVTMSDIVVTSYYVNAFRNWNKIYESLMEEEPTNLESAMEITGKKEKVMNLMKENKGKGISLKEKPSNSNPTKNKQENSYNKYYNRNYSNYILNNRDKNNLNKYNKFNYYNQNKNYLDYKNSFNKLYNSDEQNNNYYIRNKPKNEINNNQKSKLNNDEINEITKRLSDLKISFCVNCMKVGHSKEECVENKNNEDYLN